VEGAVAGLPHGGRSSAPGIASGVSARRIRSPLLPPSGPHIHPLCGVKPYQLARSIPKPDNRRHPSGTHSTPLRSPPHHALPKLCRLLRLRPHHLLRPHPSRPLRTYQSEIAGHIFRSIACRLGLPFTVVMARQMGKNEFSGHLELQKQTNLRLEQANRTSAATASAIGPTAPPRTRSRQECRSSSGLELGEDFGGGELVGPFGGVIGEVEVVADELVVGALVDDGVRGSAFL
jgi:hypothetical protein